MADLRRVKERDKTVELEALLQNHESKFKKLTHINIIAFANELSVFQLKTIHTD